MVAPSDSRELLETADEEHRIDNAADTTAPYVASADEDFTMGGRRIPSTEQPLLNQLHKQDGVATAAANSEAPTKKKSNSGSWLGKAGGFLKKHKILVGGGGVVAMLIVVAIIFLLSAIKIPNLIADITGIEFTRLFRQFSSTAIRINEEALAYQMAGDNAVGKSVSLREQLLGEYPNERSLLAKIQGLRPSKIAGNLDVAKNIQLDYAHGDRVLRSISLVDDEGNILRRVSVPEPTALDKLIPGWRTLTRGITGKDARLGAQLADLVSEGFERSGVSRVGAIIRGSIISAALREQIGAKLVGFTAASLAKYATADRQTADAMAIQESVDATRVGGQPDPHSTIPGENDALTEADHVLTEGVQHVEQAAKPKTLLRKAGDVARKVFAQGGPVQEVVKVADPAYLLALTMCTVYEGSMERSGSAITSNTQNLMNEFFHAAAIADQQKSGGPPALAAAIGAANDQFGDISTSIPYQKASGMTVDTSEAMPSPETDGNGQYTLINASVPRDDFSQAVANMVLNPSADKICGGLLSPQGIITAIAIQIAILVATLGTSSGGEVGADAAAQAGTRVLADGVIDETATQAAARVSARSVAAVIGQKISKDFWSRAGLFLFKEGAKLGGIVLGTDALTFAAQWWVYYSSSWMWSGMEQNEDYANAVGAGGNLVAQENERAILFAPAMTCAEIRESNQLDTAFTARSDQAQGLGYRYLSLDNPRSLLVRTASIVQTGAHSAFGSSSGLANLLLLPFQSFGSFIGSITGAAEAATPCANENYGNVQFGWSKSEEDLIDSSDSYLPLQNQKILDQSHQSKAIAEDYSYCFGYDYNPDGDGSFDPTDPNGDLVSDVTGRNASDGKDGSIGGLLSNGDIVRTANGDVVANQGHCSPQNLGVNNPKYGDLVFRWRLARRYEATLSQLTNLQTVTK